MRVAPRSGLHRHLLLTACVLLAASAAEAQKLEAIDVTLRQYDGGAGMPADWEFAAGDTVYLSFRIAGFRTEEKDDSEFLRLSYRIQTFDPEGLPVIESAADSIGAEMTSQDRGNGWLPVVLLEAPLPQAAPSGGYRFRVELRDEVGDATTTEELPFRVRGRDVEPSDELVIRNFRFYRSQTSLASLSVPAYRPGDTVWARFDMTGYEFADNNRFHINYGLSVLRANGEVLFDQEVAADEQRESFYPERHIPGSFGLPLTNDLSEGDYTIVVTVRDLLGDQVYGTKEIFHVD